MFARHAGRFDLILDTVSANHDFDAYLGLVRRDGTMVLVGVPEPSTVTPAALIFLIDLASLAAPAA